MILRRTLFTTRLLSASAISFIPCSCRHFFHTTAITVASSAFSFLPPPLQPRSLTRRGIKLLLNPARLPDYSSSVMNTSQLKQRLGVLMSDAREGKNKDGQKEMNQQLHQSKLNRMYHEMLIIRQEIDRREQRQQNHHDHSSSPLATAADSRSTTSDYAELVRIGLQNQLETRFSSSDADSGASAARDYADTAGWNDITSYFDFTHRFLQPQRITLDWHIPSSSVTSSRVDHILSRVLRSPGDYRRSADVAKDVQKQKDKWRVEWREVYGDEPSKKWEDGEQLPEYDVRRAMIELLRRDACILRCAPLLLSTEKQEQMYVAFQTKLKEQMLRQYEREYWERTKAEMREGKAMEQQHPSTSTTAPSSQGSHSSQSSSSPQINAGVDLLDLPDIQQPPKPVLKPEQQMFEMQRRFDQLRMQMNERGVEAVDQGDEEMMDEQMLNELLNQAPAIPAAPRPSTTLPRTKESRRSSNATFFQRLSTSTGVSSTIDTVAASTPTRYISPLSSPPPHAHLQTLASLTALFSDHVLHKLHSYTMKKFCAEYDLPDVLVRRVLNVVDRRVEREYEMVKKEMEMQGKHQSSSLQYDISNSEDALDSFNTSSTFDDLPPLPLTPHPLHDSIHATLLARNACYASTGGLVRSMSSVPLSRMEKRKARQLLTFILLNVQHAAKPSQLGVERLMNGFSESDPITSPIRRIATAAPRASLAPPSRLHVSPPPRSKPSPITPSTPPTPLYIAQPRSTQQQSLADANRRGFGTTTSSAIEEDDEDLMMDEKEDEYDEEYEEEEEIDDDDEEEEDDDDSANASTLSPLTRHSLSTEVSRTRRARLQSSSALRFERALCSFLDERGVRYVTQRWISENAPHLARKGTPDIVILDELVVRVHYTNDTSTKPGNQESETMQVRWFELKSMYGAYLEYTNPSSSSSHLYPSPVIRGWMEQCVRYRSMLGEGAVVFQNQLCQNWITPKEATKETATRRQLPTGVVFLNSIAM